MMNRFSQIILLSGLLALFMLPVQDLLPLTNDETGGKKETAAITKELRIGWDSVDGALKYQVQVMDSRNTILIDRIVDTNSINFTVPEGRYRMRVGAINIFDKVGAWSDWSDLSIVRKEAPEALRYRGIIDHGFTLSAGVTYFQIRSELRDMYTDTLDGWTLLAGYHLGNIHPLSSMFFLRNLGVELELSSIAFDGRERPTIRDSMLEILAGGINIKYTTAFSFPLNVSVRAGAGVARTLQDMKTPDSGMGILFDAQRITSTDPYYRAGLSLVMNFHSFLVETGVDFYMVDYLGTDLAGLRYFCLAGLRI